MRLCTARHDGKVEKEIWPGSKILGWRSVCLLCFTERIMQRSILPRIFVMLYDRMNHFLRANNIAPR